jgi:hypothetical protein
MSVRHSINPNGHRTLGPDGRLVRIRISYCSNVLDLQHSPDSEAMRAYSRYELNVKCSKYLGLFRRTSMRGKVFLFLVVIEAQVLAPGLRREDAVDVGEAIDLGFAEFVADS